MYRRWTKNTAAAGLVSVLVCLGFGYCAQHYVGEFGWRFDRIIGTTRSADRAAALDRRSFSGRRAGVAVFDGVSVSTDLVDAIAEADALLVSAAPDGGRDPVLAALGREIEQAPRLRTVIYLSSLGVYGDSGGRWIDETAATVPELARRGSARVDAERAWSALGRQRSLPVAILRLGGIYGPGQNAMVRLLRGTVHRVAWPGHVSNRIHVLDIAQAIDAALGRRADGVFNVVDDEPAPPSEQIAFGPLSSASRRRRKSLMRGLTTDLAVRSELLRRLHPCAKRQAQVRTRSGIALSQLPRRVAGAASPPAIISPSPSPSQRT